jgi:hypothetical protein
MNLKRNRTGGCGLDSSGSGQGVVAGSCAHDHETYGSIKWKFLDKLRNYELLKDSNLQS